MSSQPPASNKTYRKLIASINSTLKTGLLAAQRALEYQRLKTYWEIGRHISLSASSSDGKIQINQELYENISRDIEAQTGLSLTADTVGRTVQLHKNYPVFPKKTTLTFTHYLALLRVADPKERERLEQKAMKKDWSNLDIKLAVAEINALIVPQKKKSKQLVMQRGEPYVYSVHQCKDVADQKELYIDCGFKIDVPLNGMIVQSQISSIVDKAKGVRVTKENDRYIVKQYNAASEKLYTYAAKVLNVVDGDTIDVQIDVGFSIRLYDRLRFRGINAPEIDTQEGKVARQFLIDYFAQCPIIVLRTYKQKEEMYGRWLTDIFVLKDSSDPYKIAVEGEFLNQILLDEGYASIYK